MFRRPTWRDDGPLPAARRKGRACRPEDRTRSPLAELHSSWRCNRARPFLPSQSSDGAVTLPGLLPIFPIQDGVATRYAPVITWCLIASNCAVFLVQLSLPPAELEWFLARFALIPARYFHAMAGMTPAQSLADYLPFVTNMFLHGGWLHLILNMWTLWVFGAAGEDKVRARSLPRFLPAARDPAPHAPPRGQTPLT